jgi:hypothetical protein
MEFETKNLNKYTENKKPEIKEQPKKQKEVPPFSEKTIDQQKFIDNKYKRIDSVFNKEAAKVKKLHDEIVWIQNVEI